MKSLLLSIMLLAQTPGPAQTQTGTISGRLLALNGTPAVGVRVSAMPVADPSKASATSSSDVPVLASLTQTDAAGRYRLENLPAGRYYVLAGFVDSPTYYPGATSTATSTPVAVTARANITGIDFQAARSSTGLTLSGRLKRDSNEGVGGLNIYLGGNDQYPNVVSKPDGSFEFAKLKPGSYSISVSTPNFQPQQIVLVDKDIAGMEFVIPWNVDVTGTVTVEGGGMRPSLNLTFAGGPRGISTTNGRDTFRITLQEGAYAVAANGVPSGFFVKSIKSGSIDLQKEPIRLSRTSPPPSITVTLGVSSPPPWVKLTGRVTGIPTPRPSETRLTLSGPSTDALSATVGTDGSFEFPKLLPGTYSININPSPISLPGTSIVMPNSDLSGVQISFPPSKEITGRVSVEDGGPIPVTSLNLLGTFGLALEAGQPTLAQLLVGSSQLRNSLYVSLTLQKDGTFKATLPEGQYRITANPQFRNASGSVYTVKAFTYGTTDLTKDSASVSTTDTASMNLVFGPTSPAAWSKVAGRVTGVDSALLTTSPLTVTLNGSGLLTNWTSSVKPDGSFEFPKIYPGTYTVRVLPPANAANNPNARALNLGAATAVINPAGTDITGLEVAVPHQKEVTGKVTLEGRGAMPRFLISLLNPPTVQQANIPNVGATSLNINPQPDGSFRVTVMEGERQVGIAAGLPTGYTLKSMTYGTTDLLKNPLKVAASDTAELRVTLTAPNLGPVRVSGTLTGVDDSVFTRGPVTATLSGANTIGTLTVPIAADRSFQFPEVFPGSYSVRVTGGGIANSPNVSVVVASADVADIEIAVPRQKEITGRIILEGLAPMPRFQVSPLFINPQPDGVFRMTLLVGEHSIGPATGVPAGYTVKSFTYGTTDLLKNPLKVSDKDTDELRITMTTPGRPPVQVSGHVSGLSDTVLSRGAVTVSMTSPAYVPALSASVMMDGTFEFPEVFAGSYTARLIGPGVVNSPTVPITVANSEVRSVEIALPRQREITGKVILEGTGPMARMTIPLLSSAGPLTGPASVMIINPQPDGTFRLTLQEDEQRLGSVTGLPPGYALKSLTYGSTDVLKNPIKVASSDSIELRAVVTTSNPTPVHVSGRVLGLDAASFARGPVNASMTSSMYVGGMNTVVRPDGTFDFAAVYPGSFVLRAMGPAVLNSPNLPVTVANTDVQNIEIRVPVLKDITGHLVIEGGGPYPLFALPLASLPASVATPGASGTLPTIRPGPDGTFHIGLPAGESRVTNFIGLPPGYTLKAFSYGSTDLQKNPLKVAAGDTAELQITLVNMATPVKVSGRVEGVDLSTISANPVRVTLFSSSFVIPLTADVRADGSFEIPVVYPGNYRVSAAAKSAPVLPVGAALAVSNDEITDLIVPFPK